MRLISSDNLVEAIACLKGGGVVVYPTETSYGLGCDALSEVAVARIFAIKGRPQAKGVTALLPENEFGERFGLSWTPALRTLAQQHWPGPLTIVLPVAESSPLLPDYFVNGTFAVRRSSNAIANTLVDALGVPLVSTSANISGEPDAYSAQQIFERFSREKEQPDLIIDAGVLPVRLPSTLVALNEKGEVVALRQGEITV